MKKTFEWASKHFELLKFLLTVLSSWILSFVFPFFRLSFQTPIWVIITLIVTPFAVSSLFNFYRSKKNRKFKGGERVVFLHTAGFERNYVDGYSFWNSKKIIINNTDGKTTTVHEDSVELFDPKRHGQIF